jgi:hypothetical protein
MIQTFSTELLSDLSKWGVKREKIKETRKYS